MFCQKRCTVTRNTKKQKCCTVPIVGLPAAYEALRSLKKLVLCLTIIETVQQFCILKRFFFVFSHSGGGEECVGWDSTAFLVKYRESAVLLQRNNSRLQRCCTFQRKLCHAVSPNDTKPSRLGQSCHAKTTCCLILVRKHCIPGFSLFML